jgi:hypothetical protein
LCLYCHVRRRKNKEEGEEEEERGIMDNRLFEKGGNDPISGTKNVYFS